MDVNNRIATAINASTERSIRGQDHADDISAVLISMLNIVAHCCALICRVIMSYDFGAPDCREILLRCHQNERPQQLRVDSCEHRLKLTFFGQVNDGSPVVGDNCVLVDR